MGKIIITETQFNNLQAALLLQESIIGALQDCSTKEEFINLLKSYVKRGIITATMALTILSTYKICTNQTEKENAEIEIAEVTPSIEWELADENVIVTVYNALAKQCNKDYKRTASMFNLNINDVASHKIIAIEREFMKSLGLDYGDVVKLVGTYKGLQDGEYVVHDTMNKRFNGMHKVDILCPNNIKIGGTMPNQRAKIYKLKDKEATPQILQKFAPSTKKFKLQSVWGPNHTNPNQKWFK